MISIDFIIEFEDGYTIYPAGDPNVYSDNYQNEMKEVVQTIVASVHQATCSEFPILVPI